MRRVEFALQFADEPGAFECFGFVRDKEVWLVPEWAPGSTTGYLTPVRALRVDRLPHEVSGDRITLTEPIARGLFEGTDVDNRDSRIEVSDHPALEIPIAGDTR